MHLRSRILQKLYDDPKRRHIRDGNVNPHEINFMIAELVRKGDDEKFYPNERPSPHLRVTGECAQNERARTVRVAAVRRPQRRRSEKLMYSDDICDLVCVDKALMYLTSHLCVKEGWLS